jgi:hypothetical protein
MLARFWPVGIIEVAALDSAFGVETVFMEKQPARNFGRSARVRTAMEAEALDRQPAGQQFIDKFDARLTQCTVSTSWAVLL